MLATICARFSWDQAYATSTKLLLHDSALSSHDMLHMLPLKIIHTLMEMSHFRRFHKGMDNFKPNCTQAQLDLRFM